MQLHVVHIGFHAHLGLLGPFYIHLISREWLDQIREFFSFLMPRIQSNPMLLHIQTGVVALDVVFWPHHIYQRKHLSVVGHEASWCLLGRLIHGDAGELR